MKKHNGVALAAALFSVIGFASSAHAFGRKPGSHSTFQVQGHQVDIGNDGPNNGTWRVVNASPTPEPISGLLFGAGALGYAGIRRLKRRSVGRKDVEA